ncbi:Enterobactin exporter EntS [Actinosynnema sp. ALI-1.44]
MFVVLRVRDFRLLWAGRAVGALGTWLLVVAVPLHVLHLTGSPTAAGLTLAAEFLPPVVLGAVAGAAVDRCDRRAVLVAADVLRAAAVALLLLVREADDVWLVYVALVLEGVGTAVFRPAVQAHVPTIVGTGPPLSAANSLTTATDGTIRLVGAPVGGLLLGVAGWEALVALDVLSYLLSALAISRTVVPRRDNGPRGRWKPTVVPVRENEPQGRSEPTVVPVRENEPRGRESPTVVPPWENGDGGRRPHPSRWRELLAGARFLCRDRTAGALFLVTAIFLGANAALTALLVPHTATALGGPTQTGLVLSGLGVGFLLGAPATHRLRHRPAPLLGGALTGTAAGYALLFAAPTVPTALGAAVVVGAFGSAALTTTQTLLQRLTPNAVLGRVGAAVFTGEAVATFGGALVGAAAAGDTPAAVVGACATTLVAAAVALKALPRKEVPVDDHRGPVTR